MRPKERMGIPEAVLQLTPDQGQRVLDDLPEDAEMRPALKVAVARARAEQRKINGKAGLN